MDLWGIKMTELKTLKDLCWSEVQDNCIDKSELRREAIKWIKILDGKIDVDITKDYWILSDDCESHEQIEIQKWIKYFFNINDEDLK
jgi:hypothetical protein